MRTLRLLAVSMILLVSAASADTVILRSGASYSGKFTSAAAGAITFTDNQGIKYTFPVRDVQSLVFGSSNDTVTLRSGKIYSGQFTGANPIGFEDNQGIKYQFPTSDLESLIISASSQAPAPPANAMVIAVGTEISVHTNETIDSSKSTEGQTYSATITEDVPDTYGAIAIPHGSPAKLVIRKIEAGPGVRSPELVLDLFSVTCDGKPYTVVSSDVDASSKRGVGKNKRTAEFLGGGAALGALVGGIFGGGSGAGIGAASGAGGGFLTQVFTRGKDVKVPAETTLRFRLEKTLILSP
ncbi:MAG TPA: hypothetical protein VLW84_06810 [Terriglobales bacterium]|nr:hypothetical protein [Terriglobales bacterium]